jgi:hypothetical protein
MNPVYFDFEKEMQQVAIFLNADADLVADRLELRIKSMMATGMGPSDILAVLRNDLKIGGPLFSSFASTFKRNVFPVVDNVAQGAIVTANPVARKWEWITTSADPCNDCLPRHGVKRPYSDWVRLGLPRSGFSVCGDYCKCAIVPEGSVGSDVQGSPVEVPTLAQARSSLKDRLSTDSSLQKRMAEYRASMSARKK